MSDLPPICVLVGGRGTRLGKLVKDRPKPMIEIAGKPFLWYQLRLLARSGAREIVLCVGYMEQIIRDCIGDEIFGMRVRYSADGPGLDGTLGAIRGARELLGERFLVLYGDTYLRLDYRMVFASWRASGMPAMMSVLRNEGRWESSNVRYEAGCVMEYDKVNPRPEMKWIDYGLGGLEREMLDEVSTGVSDLSELYSHLAHRRLLFGYEAENRFFDIGTPSTLAETETFLRSLNSATHCRESR